MKDKDRENLEKAIASLGGEFELVRELGRGATSVVYQLRDNALDRDLAMKVIRTTLGGDEEAVARLQREARLVAQLLHPNIVKLYGTHRLPDGSLALLMEHVPGRNLKEVLRAEGPLSIERTLRILRDIGSALAYAHRRRIVHRDVKPENIYIDEEVGSARLADFGVARPWDQDARLTLPGASLGTPAYMAPEQIDGLEVDGRTDVYSLGLVGYEMLLGHHPWEGENVFTIIFRQKNEEIPVDVLNIAHAPALARTLERSLSKDPKGRPESAMAFLEELADESAADLNQIPAAAPGPRRGDSLPPGLDVPERPAPPSEDGSTVEPLEPGGHRQQGADDTAPIPSGVATGPAEPAGPPAVPSQPAVPDRPDVPQPGEHGPERPLALPPRRPRWGVILGMSAILVMATVFGISQLLPDRSGLTDPGAFTPIPPASQTQARPDPVSVEAPEPETAEPGTTLPDGTVTTGAAGSVLALQALVAGSDGLPLPDTLVSFQVDQGAIVGPTGVRTDQDGRVDVQVRLPETPGRVIVMAEVQGAPSLMSTFDLQAEAGPPTRMQVLVGNGQAAAPGAQLPEFLGVRVVDAAGNPIADQEVRFQDQAGGGSLAPAVTRTDEVGRAFSRWTLGPESGTQRAVALLTDREDVRFNFQSTATAPEPVPESQQETPADTGDPNVPGALATPEATSPPPPPVTVVARTFAMGGSHVCHLSGGVARCRGANDRGQGGDRSLTNLRSLATGVSHGCGLMADGEAYCWGANESGQLGNGSTNDDASGVRVDTELRFSVLAAGLSHTCGLAPGGLAHCWGRNVYGQLGNGGRSDHFRPRPVTGTLSFRDLVAGWNHSCGIADGGQLYCWGSSSDGQLGDGLRIDRLSPTRVPGSFQDVAAGANHTCAIQGSDVLCWGDNIFGQLGDGTTEDRSTPVDVIGLPGSAVSVATGAVHSCALLSDRSVHCWGQNLHGQLGDGTTTNRAVPVPVAADESFISVWAGGGMTCAFGQDGGEFCWGFNQGGQLGDGSRTNRSSPVRVGGSRP